MENKLLCSILQYARVSCPYSCEVISLYAPQYSPISVPTSIWRRPGPSCHRTPSPKTPSSFLVALTSVLSAPCYDLPDLTETVLRNILDVWELCEEDQLRFVAHPLRPYIADQVVAQKPFNDVPRAIAAFSSSHEVHVQWLRTHPLSDDELLKHLDSAADDDTIFALQGFLLERPALRPIALRHSNPALRAMACWATVTPGDEELAVSVATKLTQYKTPPALGPPRPAQHPFRPARPALAFSKCRHQTSRHLQRRPAKHTPPFRLQGPISEAPDLVHRPYPFRFGRPLP